MIEEQRSINECLCAIQASPDEPYWPCLVFSDFEELYAIRKSYEVIPEAQKMIYHEFIAKATHEFRLAFRSWRIAVILKDGAQFLRLETPGCDFQLQGFGDFLNALNGEPSNELTKALERARCYSTQVFPARNSRTLFETKENFLRDQMTSAHINRRGTKRPSKMANNELQRELLNSESSKSWPLRELASWSRNTKSKMFQPVHGQEKGVCECLYAIRTSPNESYWPGLVFSSFAELHTMNKACDIIPESQKMSFYSFVAEATHEFRLSFRSWRIAVLFTDTPDFLRLETPGCEFLLQDISEFSDTLKGEPLEDISRALARAQRVWLASKVVTPPTTEENNKLACELPTRETDKIHNNTTGAKESPEMEIKEFQRALSKERTTGGQLLGYIESLSSNLGSNLVRTGDKAKGEISQCLHAIKLSPNGPYWPCLVFCNFDVLQAMRKVYDFIPKSQLTFYLSFVAKVTDQFSLAFRSWRIALLFKDTPEFLRLETPGCNFQLRNFDIFLDKLNRREPPEELSKALERAVRFSSAKGLPKDEPITHQLTGRDKKSPNKAVFGPGVERALKKDIMELQHEVPNTDNIDSLSFADMASWSKNPVRGVPRSVDELGKDMGECLCAIRILPNEPYLPCLVFSSFGELQAMRKEYSIIPKSKNMAYLAFVSSANHEFSLAFRSWRIAVILTDATHFLRLETPGCDFQLQDIGDFLDAVNGKPPEELTAALERAGFFSPQRGPIKRKSTRWRLTGRAREPASEQRPNDLVLFPRNHGAKHPSTKVLRCEEQDSDFTDNKGFGGRVAQSKKLRSKKHRCVSFQRLPFATIDSSFQEVKQLLIRGGYVFTEGSFRRPHGLGTFESEKEFREDLCKSGVNCKCNGRKKIVADLYETFEPLCTCWDDIEEERIHYYVRFSVLFDSEYRRTVEDAVGLTRSDFDSMLEPLGFQINHETLYLAPGAEESSARVGIDMYSSHVDLLKAIARNGWPQGCNFATLSDEQRFTMEYYIATYYRNDTFCLHHQPGKLAASGSVKPAIPQATRDDLRSNQRTNQPKSHTIDDENNEKSKKRETGTRAHGVRDAKIPREIFIHHPSNQSASAMSESYSIRASCPEIWDWIAIS